MPTTNRKLRVFLCHSSQDKPIVRDLYQRLNAEGWIDPWLDEEKLLPGQDWDMEIEKAVEATDVVIVCLSNNSVTKEGYVQKELRTIVNKALEKPEGIIFIIPLRLEDCSVPHSLKQYHYQDYFPIDQRSKAYQRLENALKNRAESLEIPVELTPTDFYKFISISPQNMVPPFWIAKYPVTNAQFERFLNAPDYYDKSLWVDFPKFDEDCMPEKNNWGDMALRFYDGEVPEFRPSAWDDPNFGFVNKNVPVVAATWYEANAYCKWVLRHWRELPESKANPSLQPVEVRLPTRKEWLIAAGGDNPLNRFPWDAPGKVTKNVREIFRRANVAHQVDHTAPVDAYPEGVSPYGVMDMCGNVWEWLANPFMSERRVLDKEQLENGEHTGWMSPEGYALMELCGGSWKEFENSANISGRKADFPESREWDWGFMLVATRYFIR